MTTIEKFYVIGIAIRTENKPGKAEVDIPQLWSRFMQDNVLSQIPNLVNKDVYCIYTDYEGDFTKPYTTVLGCRVSSLDVVPEGLVNLTIDTANYTKFVASGKLMDNIVYDKWLSIWEANLDRSYIADFEIFKDGLDPENAEIDIYIGVNN